MEKQLTMKKEWLEKWIEALISGKYKQGRERLHNVEENTFCCLGVLTDLVLKSKGRTWTETGKIPGNTHSWTDLLPKSIQKETGLFCDDPEINGVSLAERNDQGATLTSSRPQTFKQIAELIKNNIKGV